MGKCPDLTTSSDDKGAAGPPSQPPVALFTVWMVAKLLAASSLVSQELNCELHYGGGQWPKSQDREGI